MAALRTPSEKGGADRMTHWLQQHAYDALHNNLMAHHPNRANPFDRT